MRILCACVTLCLSLLCVYSSFSSAISATGTDAITLWFFFAWGLGLVCGGVWLLRGRSKGEAIIFAPARNRILLFTFMFVGIVGMLIFLASRPSIEGDTWWPLILQTMFAVLFASLPFLLFDQADYRERNNPAPLTGAQRRRMRKHLVLAAALGATMVAVGILARMQVDTWWAEGLYRVGFILLTSAAVLGFRLKRAKTTQS